MFARALAKTIAFASRAGHAVSARRLRSRLGSAVIAVLVLDTVVLGAANAAGSPVTAAGRDSAPVSAGYPSVQYEEAMAHASDPNRFTPGARVSRPFTPRASDHRQIGGTAPKALLAGRVSGADMAIGQQGQIWSVAGAAARAAQEQADHPVDAPASRPGSAIAATASSFELPPSPAQASVVQAAPALTREVFGFLPYWELGASDLVLDYSKLSTVAYFGVDAAANGNLRKFVSGDTPTTGWGGWTSSFMTDVINGAHANGTLVVLTIEMFAWSSDDAANQMTFLQDPNARLSLAQQAAAAVRDRGADGINLDFEPIASGQSANFVDFVRTLRAQLDAIAPGYQLTVDTTGYVGNYDLEGLTAAGAADALFIMGYDYRGAGAPSAGSVAPLTGPNYDLTDTVQTYAARVPPSKLILGVPYYGRAWSTTSNTLHAATQTGEEYGYSSVVYYPTGVSFSAQHGRQYDGVEQSPWFAYQRQNCTSTYGCVTTWREGYYEDPQSLGAKYDTINAYGLRGAGIWALGYDSSSPDLYNVIAAKFGTAAPAVAPLPPATLVSSASVIPWGSSFTLAMAGQPNLTYDVLRSPDNASWRVGGQIVTDSNGKGTWTYRPATIEWWRVVPHGASLDPTAQVGGSPAVRVLVRQLAFLRPSNWGSVASVPAGTSVSFYVVVRPIVPTQPPVHVRFVAYRYYSGSWHLITTRVGYTDSTGVARFPWRFGTSGLWYVRSIADSTAVNTNSAWSNLERYNVG